MLGEDRTLLASLLRRHETAAGRRVRVFTRLPDRPGALAELLNQIATWAIERAAPLERSIYY